MPPDMRMIVPDALPGSPDEVESGGPMWWTEKYQQADTMVIADAVRKIWLEPRTPSCPQRRAFTSADAVPALRKCEPVLMDATASRPVVKIRLPA